MTGISITKLSDAKKAASLFEEMGKTYAEIEQRAFGFFQQRGAVAGSAAEDWVRAESEVVWVPTSELIETENQFLLRVAVPGVKAKDIKATCLPDAIVVQVDTPCQEKAKKGRMLFSEFNQKRLLRRYDLPAQIEVDKTTATVSYGILQIAAPMGDPPKEIKQKSKGLSETRQRIKAGQSASSEVKRARRRPGIRGSRT
jgi:HSP20 family protein